MDKQLEFFTYTEPICQLTTDRRDESGKLINGPTLADASRWRRLIRRMGRMISVSPFIKLGQK